MPAGPSATRGSVRVGGVKFCNRNGVQQPTQYTQGQSQPATMQQFPQEQQQQFLPGQPQSFPPGQPQQFQPGQPQQFPPGQVQQFPPGQPQQFQPGQPQQFPPGQPQQFPPGQPQQFPPGQPQQFPPGQPQQFPPGQPQQLPPGQFPQVPPEQAGQLQPFLTGQPGEYQPGQLFGQPTPSFHYGSFAGATQNQFGQRSTLVMEKASVGIQTGSRQHCETKKSIKCVNICTCCASKPRRSQTVEESEDEREPHYGEAICAHTFCVLERARCKPIGLPWASGLFNHQQRALPECEPCYEPPRLPKKKKKCIPLPICQTRGPTYTTDQMMAFLKLLLLAIEITDEKEDKKNKDESGKDGNEKSKDTERTKSINNK